MVWLFGGAFLVGGSMGANFLDNYLYSGQEIADRGDVIVVTLGYRVGTMGFLSTGDSNLPGRHTHFTEPGRCWAVVILLTSWIIFDLQETMVCGISMLPSPGCTETSAHLEATPTTSPSLGSLQVELALASR